MNLVTKILLCIVGGYLIGTFSTGYIIGRSNHLDIRDYGSGNAGTTNAFRVMGKKAGVITFIGDFLKAFIPLALMKYVLLKGADECSLLMLIFGIMCVIGHNYPVWLKFKGGKGIAATGGVFVAFDPWILIPGTIIFGGVIYLSKYVSLGSICLSFLFPIWVILTKADDPYYGWLIALTCLFTLSARFRHRSNIVRLINGTENKVGQHVDPGVNAASDQNNK